MGGGGRLRLGGEVCLFVVAGSRMLVFDENGCCGRGLSSSFSWSAAHELELERHA